MFIEAIREWRAQKGWLSNLKDPARWVFDWLYGGGETGAGVTVGPRSALENTPFLRGVRLIGESLSAIPLNLMEQTSERKKRIRREDDTHWLLHAQPSEMMTAAVFRQVLNLNTLTHGYGVAFIERNAATQRPVALLPLDSARTRPVREKGRYFFETFDVQGRSIELNPRDVIFIPWLSWDGITAESPVRIGRRSLGLGIAAEEGAAKFFGQGMQPGGVIEQSPGNSLTQPQLDNLRTAVEAKYGGLGNMWRPLVLQPGLSWKQLTLDLDKAQAAALREMQVADVARLLGIPLVLLASMSTGVQSYASVEQFELMFNKHTMLPWYYLYEQELDAKLLTSEERRGINRPRLFTKFNPEALLRGDKFSRAQANEIELRNGALYINEWRDMDDREESDEPNARKPLIMASNLAPLSQVGKPVDIKTAPATRAGGAGILQRMLEHEARRCVRALTDSAQKIAARHAGDRGKFATEIHDAVNRVGDDFGELFDRRHLEWFERQAGGAASVEALAPVVGFWREFGVQVLAGTGHDA